MLTFEITGLDDEPVSDARFKRIRRRRFDGGVHAADRRAVTEVLSRHRIRFRDQVPNGMRIFIGLNIAQWNDFDALELQSPVEAEDDRIDQRIVRNAFAAKHGSAGRPGPVINLNTILRKPVFVQVKRKAAQQDGDRQP